MKYLFSEPGKNLLESLTFTKTLYAFDFDGTLSPIVKNPEDATISKSILASLAELSDLVPVAIISGRSIKDLKTRLGFEPSYLIGNHGLEGLGSTKASIEASREICENWKSQLNARWGSLKNDSGIFVEDKMYSLALHYRKSRNKKQARLNLFEKIENLEPSPRIILGKSVMNLIPVGAPHKGVALLELMMVLELRSAFYIGDDDTDEDVFSLPDEGIITVRVGSKKTSHAKFFVKRQSEVHRIIKELTHRLQALAKKKKIS
ncbi:MAG: trehalose-phosphatase [Deltaproteobacteria bacterium]|nr:trehalose-phosphatase [Deltaproteobacteria bacterium]